MGKQGGVSGDKKQVDPQGSQHRRNGQIVPFFGKLGQKMGREKGRGSKGGGCAVRKVRS